MVVEGSQTGAESTKTNENISVVSDEKVNAVELGTKYTSKIEIEDFVFTVRILTLQEELLITPHMEELLLGLKVPTTLIDDSYKNLLRALSTMDYATTSIEVKETVNGSVRYRRILKGFWEWASTFTNPQLFYAKVLIPLYKQYDGFTSGIDVSLDDLKKN